MPTQIPTAPDLSPLVEPEIEGSASLEVTYDDVLAALVGGYGKKSNEDDKKKFNSLLSNHLKQSAIKYNCSQDFNILVMYDNIVMVKSDSDRIYQAITSLKDKAKPLLLILLSNGGEPGAAYLIGQLCRESSNGKFVVVVPRYAKSAATLLASAANEIHMGSLSELGPIDLQINGMPALALKYSIEHIASLVSKMPKSAQMFARYLEYSVKPIQIGYYERAAESVAQYAERLLNSHKETLSGNPSDIARKLVNDYKDHSFVIDKTEAKSIFGENTVKTDTQEYQLGNEIYEILSRVERIAGYLNYGFYFIGSFDSDPTLIEKDK